MLLMPLHRDMGRIGSFFAATGPESWMMGDNNHEEKFTHARRMLIYAVMLVWVSSFIADIYLQDYQPSAFVHLAMMTILGALFGREVLGKNGSSE